MSNALSRLISRDYYLSLDESELNTLIVDIFLISLI